MARRGLELRDASARACRSSSRRPDGRRPAGRRSPSLPATCLPWAIGRTARCRRRPLDEAGWRAVETTAIENEAYRAVGRSGARRSDQQPRRQADGQGADPARRRRQRAAGLSRVPDPPALRRGAVAPDARRAGHLVDQLPRRDPGRGIGDRPAHRRRGPVRGMPSPQEIVLWDGVERVELTTRSMTTTARTGCSASGSRPRSTAERRYRRSATPSSVVASASRTSTSPRSRSRSTIPPTTGSRWVRPPGSRSSTRTPPPAMPAAGARSASPRSSCPTTRAGRRRPSPRRRPRPAGRDLDALDRTTAPATASSTSTRTCPTSGWPSVARREPFVRRVLEAADPAYASELDRQLASAAGRGCGSRRRDAAPTSRTPRRPARIRDLPVLIVAGADPDRTIAAIDSLADDLDDATSPSTNRASSTARRGRRRTTPSPSSTRACRVSTSRRAGSCTSPSCGRAAAGRPASGSTRRAARRPMARTSSSSTGPTRSNTPSRNERGLAPGSRRPGGP